MVDYDDNLLGATTDKVEIQVAIDSGAVANVINPEELLSDVTPEPNSSDRHFVDTQGGTIEKFWSCETLMEGAHGSCKWQITDVTRALHSVSTFA